LGIVSPHDLGSSTALTALRAIKLSGVSKVYL
jgi:hypothetical protein